MLENTPFIWGAKGKKMTPEQVERQRELAALALAKAGDTSPVGHWTQGAARVVDALGGVLKDRRATKAEEMGMSSADDYVANNPVLASLIGSGGSGASMGVPAGVPVPLDATEGAITGEGFAAGEGGTGNINLRDGIIQTAQAIGADPLDLATAISYETAGTFDPMKAGPTTQWGQHRGLIQFGEPQAQQHGVDFSSPDAAIASQLGPDGAVAKYFRSSGFKPGMSGMDLYSTINAGAPGRYGASDANNGGAPGDVADKWNNQMRGHREKAMALLGGNFSPGPGTQYADAGGFAPQQDNSGVIAALSGAMSDPWVAKKYGPVIEAMMGQQMKRSDLQYQQQLAQSDPGYQMGLEKARLELEALRNPAAPKPIEVGGVLLDPITYEPIFDSRAADPGYSMVTPEEAAALGLPDGAYQRGSDGKISAVGGGGVTVNMGGGPELGKLSSDYGYVLDPSTGKPIIDPQTGLPTAAPVPGSPAALDIEKRQQQAEMQGDQTIRAASIVMQDIDRAIEQSNGFGTTGLLGGLTDSVGGTPAHDLQNTLRTVQANIGFDRLQQMREASPTGGALGAVSERELTELQAVMGSVKQSQSKEQLQRNLERLKQVYTDIMRKASAYPNASEFGFQSQQPAPASSGIPDFSSMTDEELDAYIAEKEGR